MPRRVVDLFLSDATEDKLAAHRLRPADALRVLERRPRFVNQDASDVMAPDGSPRRRPARIKMIGPDSSGRLLTFILDLPDADGVAYVVTGWIADKDERARYRQMARGPR